MTAQNTSSGFSKFVSTIKTLTSKMWYLMLGALVTFLVVECRRLQLERDEMTKVVQRSMDLVERTNEASLTCLVTLTAVKEKLQWINWELDFSTPQVPMRRSFPHDSKSTPTAQAAK